MNISISGDPETLGNLFTAAAKACREDGSYSFSLLDERGVALVVDIEADPSYEGLEWEQS